MAGFGLVEVAYHGVDDSISSKVFHRAVVVDEVVEHWVQELVEYKAEQVLFARDVFVYELWVVAESAIFGDAGCRQAVVFLDRLDKTGREGVKPQGIPQSLTNDFKCDLHQIHLHCFGY